MKKFALFSVVCFFCSRLVSAQSTISPLQDMPASFTTNVLARSYGLPNTFLVFSPDTASQILFNPARAARTEKGFVYVNYGQPNNNYATFSAAVLLNTATTSSPWLLEFANAVNNQTVNHLTSEIKSMQSNREEGNGENQSAYTAVKVSKIFPSDDGSLAIGVFGIAMPNKVTSHNESFSFEKRTGSSSSYSYELNQTRDENSNETKYAVGLEFSVARPTWDLVSSVVVQTSKSDLQSTYLYDSHSFDSSSVQESFSSETQRFSRTASPFSIGATLFYQRQLHWLTPSDHFFINLNGYYTFKTIDYASIVDNKNTSYSGGIFSNSDSSASRYQDSQKFKPNGLSVTVGYVFSQRLTDIDILVGLNVTGGGDIFFETQDNSEYFNYIRTERRFAALQLPIYANYQATNWISVFGGLNYNYTYSYYKSQYWPNLNASPPVQLDFSQMSSSFQSSNYLYLGADIKHVSGLNLQVAFRNHLASPSSWYVSLGYRF